jgi:hypothetical protein
MFSIELVQASERLSFTGKPRRMTVEDYRTVWDRKRVLRLVYDDFYDRIVTACAPGMTIEIGGGIGNLKQRLNNVVTTDIQRIMARLRCRRPVSVLV